MDSHGGWVLAAPDMAKVLAAFDLGASNPLLGPTATADMWTPISGHGDVLRGWFLRHVQDGQGAQVSMVNHGGLLWGAESFVAHRTDGLSFVFLTNGDHGALNSAVHGEELSNLANQVTNWPAVDLFPRVGVPAFQHFSGTVTTIGTGCPGSNGLPHFAGSGSLDIGEPIQFLITHGPSSSPVAVVLGLTQTSIRLDPFGAPGCMVHTDPLATFPALTDTRGTAFLPWTAPPLPAAIGATLFAQAAAVDPPANALGIITTQALQVQLGGWH